MAQYRVKRGDNLSKIAGNHDLSLNQLLAMNPRYKADPNRLAVGDRLQVTEPWEPPSPPPGTETTAQTDWFSVPMGQLTFDVEGMEKPGSRYHSRCPHVPGPWSGVTIGRGFDMSQRTRESIFDDLRAAGMPAGDARKLSRCAGYIGDAAERYLKDNDLKALSITPEAQNRLFLSTYEELAGDVIRICEKHDVVAKYGATDWQQLDPTVRDIAIDLRYRGDYTPATRRKVQKLLVANSRSRLKRLMADEAYWLAVCNVPKDRFERRRDYF
jgi:LysM repeat protein